MRYETNDRTVSPDRRCLSEREDQKRHLGDHAGCIEKILKRENILNIVKSIKMILCVKAIWLF